MRHAPKNINTACWHITKFICIIGFCIDCFTKILTNLVFIDIYCRTEFYVTYMDSAKVDMHQTRNKLIRISIFIIMNTLYKGRCAISYTDYCNSNFLVAHIKPPRSKLSYVDDVSLTQFTKKII